MRRDVLGYRQFRLVNYHNFYIVYKTKAFLREFPERKPEKQTDLKDFMDGFYLMSLQTAFSLKCVVMS